MRGLGNDIESGLFIAFLESSKWLLHLEGD